MNENKDVLEKPNTTEPVLEKFEFDLPVGGIVEISNKRYYHMGDGKFTGLGGDERPYVIEGVAGLDESDLTTRTVKVFPVKDGDNTKRQRIVYFCDVNDEKYPQ
jgi:hypothetical protein